VAAFAFLSDARQNGQSCSTDGQGAIRGDGNEANHVRIRYRHRDHAHHEADERRKGRLIFFGVKALESSCRFGQKILWDSRFLRRAVCCCKAAMGFRAPCTYPTPMNSAPSGAFFSRSDLFRTPETHPLARSVGIADFGRHSEKMLALLKLTR
jgi:hypothetical protein